MMSAIALSFSTAFAQKAYQEANFLDNTYVGIHGGVTTPLDFNHMFPLNAGAGVKIGKNWTPIVGTNIEGTALFNDNHFGAGQLSGLKSKTFVSATYVGVNGTLNLTNLFLGYNPDKTFEAGVEAGIGWIHQYGLNIDKPYTNDFGAKTGLTFAWNLLPTKAIQVYVEPAVYWNLTGAPSNYVKFDNNYAQLVASVGVVYKFKTSNGTHNFKVYDVGLMNKTINQLRAENTALKNMPPKTIEKVVEKTIIIEKNVPSEIVIYFTEGDATLDNAAKQVLDHVQGPVKVVGHASETGSKKLNQALSEKRANTVSEYLKSKNVEVVSATGEGKTGVPVARVVIVTKQ